MIIYDSVDKIVQGNTSNIVERAYNVFNAKLYVMLPQVKSSGRLE